MNQTDKFDFSYSSQVSFPVAMLASHPTIQMYFKIIP